MKVACSTSLTRWSYWRFSCSCRLYTACREDCHNKVTILHPCYGYGNERSTGTSTSVARVRVRAQHRYVYRCARNTATGMPEYSYRHRTDTAFRGVTQLRSTPLCGIALSTDYVDPNCKGLTCLLASRLIGLNKRPGVQPIGVGDTSQAWIS